LITARLEHFSVEDLHLPRETELTQFILTSKIDMNGRYFVTGFRGIGWTGYIANRFLIDQLGGERIGYLEFEGMSPVVRLWERRISYPYDLLLAGENVFMASEASFPQEEVMQITGEIARWILESGFRAGIVIGGLTNAVKRDEDPPLMGVATSSARPLMEEYDIEWMLDDLNIVGPLAGLLFHAEKIGLPLLALLPFAESRPDRKAASVAIDKLAEILAIEVDTEELIRAEHLERKIQQMITAQIKSEDSADHHYM